MTITLTDQRDQGRISTAGHTSRSAAVLRRGGYHSVRFGSETGETGAAAVLVDGTLITADLMLAAQADGHEIETIEGLSSPGTLHPIQAAFIETGAIQSGYSTPGDDPRCEGADHSKPESNRGRRQRRLLRDSGPRDRLSPSGARGVARRSRDAR